MTSPNPSSFPLFPLLPTELRLQIYHHILALTTSPILKISFSPSTYTFIPNTAPPVMLAICAESRALTLERWGRLVLGDGSKGKERVKVKGKGKGDGMAVGGGIPVDYGRQTVYISGLMSLLIQPSLLQTFLYTFSTSPSRHSIQKLAIDLRVWNELRDAGFLQTLAGMRSLQELNLVVEFGRCFEGDLGFLEAPEWRADLRWLAGRAGASVNAGKERARERADANASTSMEVRKEKVSGNGNGKGVRVECVILTRGGEQA